MIKHFIEKEGKMTRRFFSLCFMVMFLFAAPAFAFQGAGCGGDCASCHSLTADEAAKILKTAQFDSKVKGVRPSVVKGLWEVEIGKGDKSALVYLDFAKKYVVEGKFIPVEAIGKPVSLNKVDLAKIPVEDAVIMGDRNAKKRIIVFSDPDCPYCAKLHGEIKKILEKRKDVSFFIKLFPLSIHKDAYAKSKTIICKKSVALLEDAFAGKKLPAPDCEAKEVDKNIKLAGELGIHGTPAIILPDGRMIPGYVDADALLKIMDAPAK
ncbi:MAG: DsbC family protein [Deltaproteobacteria bacterium]|nr:DsbC family protein [Deltaproteobacteria bacterium]